VKARVDPKSRVRKLHEIDLWEVSIVTFPLLLGARVRAVKEANSPFAPPARARKPLAIEPTARRRVLYQRAV
jgi:phage head maturation protease